MRMEALFAKLAWLPAGAFKDTVFKQYQLAFSLMVVVDRIRDAKPDTGEDRAGHTGH